MTYVWEPAYRSLAPFGPSGTQSKHAHLPSRCRTRRAWSGVHRHARRSRFSKAPLCILGVFSWTFRLERISGFSSLLNFMPNESCRLAMGSKHSGLKWSLQSFELGVGPLHLARVSFTFAVQMFRYLSSLGKLCILVPFLQVLPQPAATHLVGILRNISRTSVSWSY